MLQYTGELRGHKTRDNIVLAPWMIRSFLQKRLTGLSGSGQDDVQLFGGQVIKAQNFDTKLVQKQLNSRNALIHLTMTVATKIAHVFKRDVDK